MKQNYFMSILALHATALLVTSCSIDGTPFNAKRKQCPSKPTKPDIFTNLYTIKGHPHADSNGPVHELFLYKGDGQRGKEIIVNIPKTDKLAAFNVYLDETDSIHQIAWKTPNDPIANSIGLSGDCCAPGHIDWHLVGAYLATPGLHTEDDPTTRDDSHFRHVSDYRAIRRLYGTYY